MMEVAACIAGQHDLRLVTLAVVICLIGSAATVQLFARVRASRGRSRLGWIIISSVGTGTMVWCTHFVAMMAFHSGLPVTLDPSFTLASLAVAIALTAPGLAIANSFQLGPALIGGAIVGVAISAMHYVGMAAYRIDGIAEWRPAYVTASVLLSSILSALAFEALRKDGVLRRIAGSLLLATAVASLHFTAMTALKIAGLDLHRGNGMSGPTMTALAMTTACAGLLFVGCAVVSALIDGETQNESYRRLRHMALHDGLTGLPNRLAFHEELAARTRRDGAVMRTAVAMIDLSRFKHVNDTYGHRAGDDLLSALAARLKNGLVGEDCIARLGGDEFAAVISFAERPDLDDVLGRLAGAFSSPFAFERFQAKIDGNIGVAISPENGSDADTLLARADIAMYWAKSLESDVPCFYDDALGELFQKRRDQDQGFSRLAPVEGIASS